MVWGVSESVNEIQDGMVIVNVGMRKGVELRSVSWILSEIGSIGLTIGGMIFGRVP